MVVVVLLLLALFQPFSVKCELRQNYCSLKVWEGLEHLVLHRNFVSVGRATSA